MSRPGDWNCRSCNHLNFQRRDSCQRCGDPRADFGGGSYGGGRVGGSSSFGFTTGPDVRPGDWYCTVANCGAHNFSSRSICFKCGATKDETSAAAYDGDLPRMRGFNFGGASNRPGWKSDRIAMSTTLRVEGNALDAMRQGIPTASHHTLKGGANGKE
ncbi:putative RNA-binding protein C17H9.04c [Cucumis melo var. makuwa]|uniref:RNA-binding protein C17H9.04c n=1 Tax=Cucumis melo var. makuwa TaxID=1194695 RepID=A0A5A7VHK5_CUCMM|nr:putative RNA-binding protein C17H9.04c [Cucumis melo var. makuwa]